MKAFFIGTDIGTSGTKSVVVALDGKILSESLIEYGLSTPHPVWAEQEASLYVDAAQRTIIDAVQKSGVNKQDIKGICISGLYGGSGIPLDSDMNPIRPCIIWMDRRAEAECAEVRRTLAADELFEITGNGVDSYFGFAKMLWLKNNEPENFKKTALFLTPNQYVVYRFTGEAVIDYTSAGNLGGIYDLRNHCWSERMAERIGIPLEKLPKKIVRPQDIAGTLKEDVAELLGLCEGTPVCAGCIDCLASTLAAGALDDGQHVAIIGTSINWGVIHRDYPSNIEYISMPYSKEPDSMIYTYGGASTAGALPRWFRDDIVPYINSGGSAKKTDYRLLDDLAGQVRPGSDGLIVLPYFMGERSPIWDVNARGTIFGLTLKHTNVHIYRALLEAVAYSLRHIMETSNIKIQDNSNCVLVGGASKSRLWKQIFADVTGVPILCSRDYIEAPLGDALIAAVGTGYLQDFDEIKKWVKFEDTTVPDKESHEIYNKYFSLYKKLYLSLKEDMELISAIGQPRR